MICDFAEVYHVYDWRALPVKTAATLAAGLPEHSRSIKRLIGQPCDLKTLLLAAIVDRLSLLVWAKTKDGQKGRKRPEMLLKNLLKDEAKISEFETFADVDAFEAARQRYFKE